MKNFAVLDSELRVENVVIADSKEGAEEITGKQCIEYRDLRSIQTSWLWDGEKFNSPDNTISVVPFSDDEDFLSEASVELPD